MSLVFSNNNYKSENCFSDTNKMIGELNKNKSHNEFIIIVPTGKYAKQLKNNVIRSYWEMYKEPIGGLNIFTIENFISELVIITGLQGEQFLISSAFGQALFEKIATETELGFYRKSGRKMSQNLISRLFSIVYGLREDGITNKNFEDDLSNSDTEMFNITHPGRYKDIMELFSNYAKATSDRITDIPGLLNSLVTHISTFNENSEALKYLRNKHIFIYGFSEFKEPELNLFTTLANRKIPVAVHLDLSYSNGPLFNNLTEISTKLRNSGFNETISDKDDNTNELIFFDNDEINKPHLTYIRRWLFNTEKDLRNPGLSDTFKIFVTGSRIEEVNTIARLVKHLVKDKGYQLSDICICFRNPGKYSSLFRDVFSAHGIDYNVSDRFNLASSTVINAIFNVLDVLIGNFKRTDVIKCLQSPYMNLKNSKDGRPIDSTNLNIVANKLRISGGNRAAARYWIERLNFVINFNENLIGKYSDQNIKDLQELEGYKSNLENYKKAKLDFENFIAKIPSVNQKLKPNQLSNIIINGIIKDLGIESSIIELYEKINEQSTTYKGVQLKELEKDARALREFVDLLNEFVRNLNVLYPDRKYDLSDIVANLKTAVSASKFQIRERRKLGVDITSIEQTRGMTYKVSILCGALDREFPMAYSPESFLGKELHDSEDRHLRKERQLFYQFLTNEKELLNSGDKKIYIFYPQKDENNDLVRSPFIDSLLKISSLESDNKIVNLTDMKSNRDSEANIITDPNAVFSLSGLQRKWNSMSNNARSKLLEIIGGSLDLSFINYLNMIESSLPLNNTLSNIDAESNDSSFALFLEKSFKKGISVSAIDEYASCPFKFFANRVLKFETPEEEEEFLSPIEKGSLKHNILFRLYRTIQIEQIEKDVLKTKYLCEGLPDFAVLQLELNDIPHLKEKMRDIATEETERVKFDHPFFEIESRELEGSKNIPGFIGNWINSEYKRFEESWKTRPALFEFSFGLPFTISGNNIQPVKISRNINLRGKVDRVEYHETGTNKYFVITDYKNKANNKFKLKAIEGGKSFQMPLYAAAIQKILAENYGIDAFPGGFVYYLTVPDWGKDIPVYEEITALSESIEHREIKKPKTDNDILSIINNSIDIADGLMDSIFAGDFSATPSNNSCMYCQFETICRKDDRI